MNEENSSNIKKCSYCQNKINVEINDYYKCLDNFLQAKYFDTEDENIFCCQECFCNYVQLEWMNGEDDEE